MTTLSVIIPCYNCEGTLQEAVDSVYRQSSPIPFDITMVDDGSTDGTYAVMRRLAAQHPDIKLVRHTENLGGGATRNTAVANSMGDLIFCLDSDDMMGHGFLHNMVGFWMDKRCDAVGTGVSIKFKKRDINDVAYVTKFARPGLQVPFESLLDGSECSLMSTFLITREAFNQIGGYPAEHGFDTQGIAWRFLANGLTAYTCPDALYHHRVQFHQSYYLREDRVRRHNWNWLLILTEFLYVFNQETKELILGRDLVCAEAAPTLEAAVRTAAADHSVYAPRHAELVRMGRDQVALVLRDSMDKFDQYWLGEYLLSIGKAGLAAELYQRALQAGFSYWILHCRIMQAALQLSDSSLSVDFPLERMHVRATKRGLRFEAAVPPVSAYQRLENWLLRRRGSRGVGVFLKGARMARKKKLLSG